MKTIRHASGVNSRTLSSQSLTNDIHVKPRDSTVEIQAGVPSRLNLAGGFFQLDGAHRFLENIQLRNNRHAHSTTLLLGADIPPGRYKIKLKGEGRGAARILTLVVLNPQAEKSDPIHVYETPQEKKRFPELLRDPTLSKLEFWRGIEDILGVPIVDSMVFRKVEPSASEKAVSETLKAFNKESRRAHASFTETSRLIHEFKSQYGDDSPQRAHVGLIEALVALRRGDGAAVERIKRDIAPMISSLALDVSDPIIYSGQSETVAAAVDEWTKNPTSLPEDLSRYWNSLETARDGERLTAALAALVVTDFDSTAPVAHVNPKISNGILKQFLDRREPFEMDPPEGKETPAGLMLNLIRRVLREAAK